MKAIWAGISSSDLAALRWHAAGLLGAVVLLTLGLVGGWVTQSAGAQVTAADDLTRRVAVLPALAPASGPVAKPIASTSDALESPRVWEASPPPVIDAKAKALTPEVWRISGVYGTSEATSVILEFPARQTSDYVKKGGELPNGAKVLAVGAHSVTVKTKVANQWKTIVLDLDADNF